MGPPVRYRRADRNKSELYLEMVPLFTRGQISIPDFAPLTKELRLLERRVARSGKDNVDHPVGGSDDHANVLAGVAALASAKALQKIPFVMPFSVSRSRSFPGSGGVSSGIGAADWTNRTRFS